MKISIENNELVLERIAKSDVQRKVKLPDVWIHFAFYRTKYLGVEMLILEQVIPNNFTPLRLKYMAEAVYSAYNMPTIFYYEQLEYYQRQRFIEYGIYFLVGNKYAYLPMLLINAKMTKHKPKTRLSAVAQWLLLYHLQVANLNGKTARELVQCTPYQYITLTRAFRTLNDLHLCVMQSDVNRFKHIYFIEDKKVLLETAKPYFINPIEQVWYCDECLPKDVFPTSGINALSHYSMLNDEEQQTFALTEVQMKEVQKTNRLNPIEGVCRLEQWAYPPLTKDKYVDRLSLALALQDDHDPRVAKEVKQLFDILC